MINCLSVKPLVQYRPGGFLNDNFQFSSLCIVELPRAGQSLSIFFWLVGMQAMELRCYDLIDCG